MSQEKSLRTTHYFTSTITKNASRASTMLELPDFHSLFVTSLLRVSQDMGAYAKTAEFLSYDYFSQGIA